MLLAVAVAVGAANNDFGLLVRMVARSVKFPQFRLLGHVAFCALPLTTLVLQLFPAIQDLLDQVLRIVVRQSIHVEPADLARKLLLDIVGYTWLLQCRRLL